MTSLPQIRCNGYVFNPVKKQSTVSYEIGTPLKEDQWVITKRKNDQPKAPKTVKANRSYSIKSELRLIHQMTGRCFLSAMGGILATGVSAYFTIAKKNFHIGGGSLALAGVCAVAYVSFNKQCKVASFLAANTILSALKNSSVSLYQPADYGL